MMRVIACFVVASITAAAAQQPKPPQDPKPPQKGPAAGPKTPLECLQAAYDGESNAHARYVEFAKKADAEGYAGVASLFRAAAQAEKIHAENHAAVIKKLGAAAKADVKKPDVKTTKENLEAALKGESYERDTMYPDFLKIAQAAKNKDAVQTFNYAKAAETEHAKLYKDALENLGAWKAGKKEFFVCAVCGNTLTKIDFKKCPVCFSPREKYGKVN
jgi:rubrerythrin